MEGNKRFPIVVLSFNRPDYLFQTLSSLKAQSEILENREVALFQDGSWSRSMNMHHADPALCKKCVEVFREQFSAGTVFDSEINLGSVFNYERAERYVFETLGAPAAIFLEDDLVLGRSYLTVLERLINLALADDRIGYVAAYGNWRATREQQLKNARNLRPMHLLWAFGLTQGHWRKCRPYVEPYLEIIGNGDYRQRDHEKISALVQSWGVQPGDTGQDRIKCFATALVGAIKINTEVAYGRYIGKEGGLNFNPRMFEQWGLDEVVSFDEVVSLDFDLSSVSFDPWFPGNNVSRLVTKPSRTPYDNAFYTANAGGAKRSARIIAPMVVEAIRPKSVVDVGCGVGAWLAEFERAGISDCLGVDGEYVPPQQLQISPEHFRPVDLTSGLSLGRRYDLAVCLEVAEHLPEAQSKSFVAALTRLAPVVLFSAAIPNQGGTGHVNEQWQDYWRGLFAKHDFAAVDSIRPRVWGNAEVNWWYQQNTVLYVERSALSRYPRLETVEPDRTLNVVHPALFEARTAKQVPISRPQDLIRANSVTAEENFVRSLYHVLLLREPDSGGMSNHLRAIRAGRSFEEVLRDCVRSVEFADKLEEFAREHVSSRIPGTLVVSELPVFSASDAHSLKSKVTPDYRQLIPEVLSRNGVVRHVASLGTRCYSSWLISRMGLRKYSLPFDYIFSDLGMVAHCIQDDFQTLLDASQYRRVDGKGRCSHDFYSSEFKLPIIFNHHDVTQEQHYEHFIRAAERFRRLFAAEGSKLFLCVSEEQRATDEKIKAVSDAISAKADDATLLVIRVCSEKRMPPEILPVHRLGIATTLEMFASSVIDGGLSFRNDVDNRMIEGLLRGLVYDIDEKIRGDVIQGSVRWGSEDAGVAADQF